MTCDLRPPATPADWTAYHHIRRTVLFDRRGVGAAYDPNHPDDRRPGNHALVLRCGGSIVGVIRVDVDGTCATFRRVAIREELQRKGHGREMLALAERFARDLGCTRLESFVDADAVGFYVKCGWREDASAAPTHSPFMVKEIVD